MTPKEEAKKIDYESLQELNMELLAIGNDFIMQGDRAKAKIIYIAHELFEKILKNKAPKEITDSVLEQQQLFNSQEYTEIERPYGI